MDRTKQVEKLLELSADMQELFDPEDELSSIVADLGSDAESELTDDELDLVIAAVKDPQMVSNNKNRKKGK